MDCYQVTRLRCSGKMRWGDRGESRYWPESDDGSTSAEVFSYHFKKRPRVRGRSIDLLPDQELSAECSKSTIRTWTIAEDERVLSEMRSNRQHWRASQSIWLRGVSRARISLFTSQGSGLPPSVRVTIGGCKNLGSLLRGGNKLRSRYDAESLPRASATVITSHRRHYHQRPRRNLAPGAVSQQGCWQDTID